MTRTYRETVTITVDIECDIRVEYEAATADEKANLEVTSIEYDKDKLAEAIAEACHEAALDLPIGEEEE